ncbi:MAG: HAMP domain-containing histidine kinase [Psychromonas sp.]|nr:HAMP domain-containing histidine kinase [Psychromonas sp.]
MNRLSIKKLRLLFALFFFALAIPSSILSFSAYQKLRWESFHQYQQNAHSLALEIDSALSSAMLKEEARSDTDYTFLVIEGDPEAGFLQRSILSRFPVESDLPGIVGYFQVNAKGQFSSPLLPDGTSKTDIYGIGEQDKQQRELLVVKLHKILSENQLVSALAEQAPEVVQDNSSYAVSSTASDSYYEAEEMDIAAPQAIRKSASGIKGVSINQKSEKATLGFSKLESSEQQKKISQDLEIQQGYVANELQEEVMEQTQRILNKKNDSQKRVKRKEQTYIAKQKFSDKTESKTINTLSAGKQSLEISLFESELEPFRFSLLKSGHFVAYRQVWRDEKRLIQGAILTLDDFFNQAVAPAFVRSPLSGFTNLSLAYRGNLLKTRSSSAERSSYNGKKLPASGELLFTSSLSEPFAQLSLVFHINEMPMGSGGQFILTIAASLIAALIFGTSALYRLTFKQAQLAQQHQDFISSVSHELKTPITSIQMYGEILKQGWADKEKREEYYDFIYSEAERLSRLVANILQISKVSRNSLNLQLTTIPVSELADMISSKIDSQIKQSGFDHNLLLAPAAEKQIISVDSDAFIQIIINLVDNAIKYSGNSEIKQVDIELTVTDKKEILISVRDYGSGIAKNEIGKIFDLFYRVGNEMTRESQGTGIGLALVKELTQAMNGKVKVISHHKGAEFSVTFPIISKGKST